jgi:hypothetical protein
MTELNWTATVVLTIHNHPFMIERDITGVATMRLTQTACTNKVQVVCKATRVTLNGFESKDIHNYLKLTFCSWPNSNKEPSNKKTSTLIIQCSTASCVCGSFSHKSLTVRRTQLQFCILLRLHVSAVFEHHRAIKTIVQSAVNNPWLIYTVWGIPQVYKKEILKYKIVWYCRKLQYLAVG